MAEIKFYRASDPHGFLSNLYKREIEFEGRIFRSSEEAYQFAKPKDPAVAEWIISAPKQHLVARAGHSLLPFDVRPDWNDIKVERMRKVLYAKFTQHDDLKQQLLNTGDSILIEDSPTDNFWGIGAKGNGRNMLGLLLMELREQLFNNE